MDNANSSKNSREKKFCVCDEYAEIERFVKEKNLSRKMKNIIPRIKFACYMWNYKRLDRKSGIKFLKVFSKEMRGYLARNEIKKEYFSLRDCIKVYIIAYSCFIFHISQCFSEKEYDG
jgi:hypothetical protein